MIHFPRPTVYPFRHIHNNDFATICFVCLKVWAVCGNGESGFEIEQVVCPGCAYSEVSLSRHRWGLPWWSVESSLIDPLYSRILIHLVGTRSGLQALLDTLPPQVIQHEFRVHLAAFDWFNKQAEGSI